MSISSRASSALLLPQAEKRGPSPPKVPVPKLYTGTFRPEAPRLRYSMVFTPTWERASPCALLQWHVSVEPRSDLLTLFVGPGHGSALRPNAFRQGSSRLARLLARSHAAPDSPHLV